jgi:SynChlorMet cassette radical SAM/SPASM protein ScmF
MEDSNAQKNVSSESGGRKYRLNRIYFYLTADCNLRCRHCWISPDYQATTTSSAYLPFETFKSIIAEARPLGLIGVKLTGGEPLLHPQILDILEYIRSEDLELGIETNGVLCTPEIAKAINACKKVQVSVSLDGADAETHEWVRGVDGCFEDALNGIRNLVNAGRRPQIIMSVMRRNRDQIGALVELAKSLNASSVKLNIVTPTERGKVMHMSGESLDIEELIEIGKWVENTLSKTAGIPVYYAQPMAFRPMGNMFGDHSHCGICAIFNIIGVLADGNYAMCGIGENVPELTCGNAATHRLKDVWENTAFLCELREGLPKKLEGICSECSMKSMCFGMCVAQNYYRHHNLWAPFWFCEEAQSKGLFPVSRKHERFIS